MGRRIALLVATYDYKDPSLRRLTAPVRDASDLKAVLADPAIGGFEVKTLLNKPHHSVGEVIGTFYRERHRDDLALLYFTGHGLKDDDGQLYLAMTNTWRDNLEFTALAAEQINRAMSNSPSRRVVLVLDCCYSGAFPAGHVAKGDTGVQVLERFGGRGRTVLTASDSTQYSFEGDRLYGQAPQSVFTRHLVAGLRSGSADLDGDGDVTLDELYSYVYERVVEEIPKQRPKKQDNVEGRIVIAQNPNWTLPAYLANGLDSPLATDRLTALRELDRLHRIGNDLVRKRVLNEYERLAEDDSRRVSDAARSWLSGSSPDADAAPAEMPPASAGEPPAAPAPKPPPALTGIEGTRRPLRLRTAVIGAVIGVIGVISVAIGTAVVLPDENDPSPGGGATASPSTTPSAVGVPGLYGLAISKDGRRIYTSNAEHNTLSMIDTAARKPVGKPIAVGEQPLGVAVSPGGLRAYVVSGRADSVWKIDTTTGMRVGSPTQAGHLPLGIAVHPTRGRAYVTNRGSDNVSVVDTDRNKAVVAVDVGDNPLHIAVSPDGRRAFVTNLGSSSVTVIDTEANRTTGDPIVVARGPKALALSPDGTRLYVTHGKSPDVSVIDTSRSVVVGRPIRLATEAWQVIVGHDGRRMYATLHQSGQVAVIDVATGAAVSAPIPVGQRPTELAISADGGRLYVANNGSGTISVIATDTNRVIGVIPVPG